MKMIYLFLGVLVLFPSMAWAQNEGLDVSSEPICFAIRNSAEYRVNGTIATEKFERPDGIRARHRSNFRLQKAGTIEEESGKKTDRVEFCSYGPFLANRQLILTLKTLFPVFECNTRVDTGQEIVIRGARKADDSGVDTWAECFEADGSKAGRPKIGHFR